jgi:ketosteroid isomerase-like protein
MSDHEETRDEALVRRTFDLFNARDAEGIVELMAPEGELYPYAIDARRHDGYRGHDGVRAYIADVGKMFAEFRVDIDTVRDVGDGVVLAEGRIGGRTVDGIPVDMAAAWLWTVSEGRLTRMQAHPASPREG